MRTCERFPQANLNELFTGKERSLYERGSLLNHSCAVTCTRVTLRGGGAERALVTLRPVAAGEELTLSYLPSGMEILRVVQRWRHRNAVPAAQRGHLERRKFALAMANTVPRSPPTTTRRCFANLSAPSGGGHNLGGSEDRSLQGGGQQQQQRRRQERPDSVRGLLKASAAVFGSRHWATFSCALLRLERELYALSEHVSGPRPTPSPSRPEARMEFLEWAMQELNALCWWLDVALETATGHPPAHDVFDVVCDLLGLGEASGGEAKEEEMVMLIGFWWTG
eukprot:g19142.t1